MQTNSGYENWRVRHWAALKNRSAVGKSGRQGWAASSISVRCPALFRAEKQNGMYISASSRAGRLDDLCASSFLQKYMLTYLYRVSLLAFAHIIHFNENIRGYPLFQIRLLKVIAFFDHQPIDVTDLRILCAVRLRRNA